MNKFSAFVSTFIYCMIIWFFLVIPFGGGMDSLEFRKEMMVGGCVSLIIAFFCYKFLIHRKPFWLFNPVRIISFIIFMFIFFVELVKSNLDVAIRALSPKVKVNPGFVKIQTPVKSDYGLAMLANCITLTPGTITMDIKRTRKENYMFIHWIDVKSENIKNSSEIIKGSFEPWVRRVFK